MARSEASARLFDRLGNMVSAGFLLALVLTMAASGWIAFYEGTHRFMLPFTTDNAAQQITDAVKSARSNPTDENIRQVSEEIWALSRFVPAQRFSESKLVDQGIYYASMPKPNQVIMVVHILLSVFCVSLGGLQFWPAFRKRFMQLHRRIGMTYVVTAPLSVVAAFFYMALTAPYNIYANLVAWLALWVFGFLAILSIAMAMLALKARRLFEHQAWMALSFGCLLVAPLLRLDWVLLVPFFPNIDQETLNLTTMGIMLPECLLLAYGLTLVNRQYARPMKQRSIAAIGNRGTALFLRAVPAAYAVAVILLVINVLGYFIDQGMSGMSAATGLVPTALIQREHSVLTTYPMMTILFVTSISLAFPAVVFALKKLFLQKAAPIAAPSALSRATPILTLAAGVASCFLGWHIGLGKGSIWLSGGTLYTVNGL